MQRHRSPIEDGRHSVAVEDYLRTLIVLDDAGEPLSTANIAGHLQITCASVTQMAQRLAGLGLVEYQPYRALRLTTEGRRAAEAIQARHRLMCTYLELQLDYAPADAIAEADLMEHAMSQELCNRIEHRLANATVSD